MQQIDELAEYNQGRWEALAQADIAYSRPLLALDEDSARQWLQEQGGNPPEGLGDFRGKDVLCLASGGGQQSAVFGVLGANVTVFDLTAGQLQRDEEVAAHYGFPLQLVQGDMRDLSCFEDGTFDLVWQPYSLNFIPDAQPLFNEVARILRNGGRYRLEFANPYLFELDDTSWQSGGYRLTHPYLNGAEIQFEDPHWEVEASDGSSQRVLGPREFRHTLSSVLNSLIGLGFTLRASWENPTNGDPDAEPGSWEHFVAIAPPWLGFWFTYQPNH